MRRVIALRELEFRLGIWFRQISDHSSTQQRWTKRLPMLMEILLSLSMLLRSTCSLLVSIISLGQQRHLSVAPCVSFSVASNYDRSFNQQLQPTADQSHRAVIRVYDGAGNVIQTHEHKGDFCEW
jgi:hypothetical protein